MFSLIVSIHQIPMKYHLAHEIQVLLCGLRLFKIVIQFNIVVLICASIWNDEIHFWIWFFQRWNCLVHPYCLNAPNIPY